MPAEPNQPKPEAKSASEPKPKTPPAAAPNPAGELSPEEQMENFARQLKEDDWGHQPC